MITFQSTDVKYRLIGKREISNWIKKVFLAEGKSFGDISIVFCSDKYLLEINQKFLKHNTLTDVITFNYTEKDQLISGDIIISIERVIENASSLNIPVRREVLRVIIHGVLHLLGYNDKTADQKTIMTSKEDIILGLI